MSKREVITNELKEAFVQSSTLDELADPIRKAKTNSSAGMNRVSYNMIKNLPRKPIANIHFCVTRVLDEWGMLD